MYCNFIYTEREIRVFCYCMVTFKDLIFEGHLSYCYRGVVEKLVYLINCVSYYKEDCSMDTGVISPRRMYAR